MKAKDQFSADMGKVFSLVNDFCGNDCIQETLFSHFNADIDISAENKEDWVESYTYSDSGMFYVLYCLNNYDLISLQGNSINVEGSNCPDIAEIFKKYAKAETIEKVNNQFC